jgi:thymidylate synthase (FAD)
MYVRWRWTVSLNAVLHFLSLRLDSHAQWEIQQYAKAVEKSVHQYYPMTSAAWTKHRL